MLRIAAVFWNSKKILIDLHLSISPRNGWEKNSKWQVNSIVKRICEKMSRGVWITIVTSWKFFVFFLLKAFSMWQGVETFIQKIYLNNFKFFTKKIEILLNVKRKRNLSLISHEEWDLIYEAEIQRPFWKFNYLNLRHKKRRKNLFP